MLFNFEINPMSMFNRLSMIMRTECVFLHKRYLLLRQLYLQSILIHIFIEEWPHPLMHSLTTPQYIIYILFQLFQ